MTDEDAYHAFLNSKLISARPVGIDIDIKDINPYLFNWQKEVVAWAL